jgi:hypothetical protein
MNFAIAIRVQAAETPAVRSLSMEKQQQPATEESSNAQDDAWLDEVLMGTFPASDPMPWRHRELRTDEPSEHLKRE